MKNLVAGLAPLSASLLKAEYLTKYTQTVNQTSSPVSKPCRGCSAQHAHPTPLTNNIALKLVSFKYKKNTITSEKIIIRTLTITTSHFSTYQNESQLSLTKHH